MVRVVIRLRFHSQPKRFWVSNPSGSSLLVDILQQDTISMYDITGLYKNICICLLVAYFTISSMHMVTEYRHGMMQNKPKIDSKRDKLND